MLALVKAKRLFFRNPIELIAHDRMSRGLEMHADLVLASGLGEALDEREFAKAVLMRTQSFEAGERALVLLRGIAQLSADLGLQVTVEAIETAEQLALISSDENITEAQGWVFAPALPAKDVSLLLERSALPRLVERVA